MPLCCPSREASCYTNLSMPNIAIRPATPADIPTVLSLLRELAAYEGKLESVQINESLLTEHAFGERQCIEMRARSARQPGGRLRHLLSPLRKLRRPPLAVPGRSLRPTRRARARGRASHDGPPRRSHRSNAPGPAWPGACSIGTNPPSRSIVLSEPSNPTATSPWISPETPSTNSPRDAFSKLLRGLYCRGCQTTIQPMGCLEGFAFVSRPMRGPGLLALVKNRVAGGGPGARFQWPGPIDPAPPTMLRTSCTPQR